MNISKRCVTQMRRKSKLDRIDIKILSTLQLAGRMTNVELAEAVGLSPNPCLARRRRLERAGYITRYLTDISLTKLGEHAEIVFVLVTLRGHGRSNFEKFEQAIRTVPEVVECYKLRGGIDYLLKCVCSDIKAYRQLSERLIQNKAIGQYVSYVAIDSVKPFSGYPLDRFNTATK